MYVFFIIFFYCIFKGIEKKTLPFTLFIYFFVLFFALSAFLDDLKPSHLNLSNMRQDPSTRYQISQSWQKHRPVFYYFFDSGLRSLHVSRNWPPESSWRHIPFKGRFPWNGGVSSWTSDRPLLGTCKQSQQSLGLKWKQKHDLLLGVAYPFKRKNGLICKLSM